MVLAIISIVDAFFEYCLDESLFCWSMGCNGVSHLPNRLSSFVFLFLG